MLRVPSPDSLPSLQELWEYLERHDYRHLLGTLNAATSYRYTALFRHDGDELRSVWTFDRREPAIDPFPPHLPIARTPCATVLFERQSVWSEDTFQDPRMGREQRHVHMRSFAGVPLFEASRVLVGALCHFDPEPLRTDADALDLLERVARLFSFVHRQPRKSGEPR